MNIKLLKLLSQNARFELSDLAVMSGITEDEAKKEIAEMEKAGLIRGYKAVIDWERLDSAKVSALIELKVTPQSDFGFEALAEKIAKYSEVESVYLMSGDYDLNIIVKGKTLQDIAWFVAKELATIDSVTSTATHFVMRRYKDMDVELIKGDSDDRGQLFV